MTYADGTICDDHRRMRCPLCFGSIHSPTARMTDQRRHQFHAGRMPNDETCYEWFPNGHSVNGWVRCGQPRSAPIHSPGEPAMWDEQYTQDEVDRFDATLGGPIDPLAVPAPAAPPEREPSELALALERVAFELLHIDLPGVEPLTKDQAEAWAERIRQDRAFAPEREPERRIGGRTRAEWAAEVPALSHVSRIPDGAFDALLAAAFAPKEGR